MPSNIFPADCSANHAVQLAFNALYDTSINPIMTVTVSAVLATQLDASMEEVCVGV